LFFFYIYWLIQWYSFIVFKPTYTCTHTHTCCVSHLLSETQIHIMFVFLWDYWATLQFIPFWMCRLFVACFFLLRQALELWARYRTFFQRTGFRCFIWVRPTQTLSL
jgi:hypothetical protein